MELDVREAAKTKARESSRAWHAANPERSRQNSKNWYENNIDKQRARASAWYLSNGTNAVIRIKMLRNSAKARAASKGLDFDLDDEWVSVAALVQSCPVLGLPFDYGRLEGARKNPLAPSLDRLDNLLGYTQDNVRVVSSWANTAKFDLTEVQFRQFILTAATHLTYCLQAANQAHLPTTHSLH